MIKHAHGAVRPLTGDHAVYALVELSAARPDADTRAEMETLLAAAIEDGVAQDATIAASGAQDDALWALREALPEVQKAEGGSIKHDVSVPLSRLADFLDEASAACEAAMPGLRVCAFGHFGDGNIHFNLSQPVGMDKAAFLSRWSAFNRIVHDIVHRMGGSIAAEHGIGLIKRDELALYGDPVALDLMRRLKTVLDPHNLLNPGKVVAIGENPPATLPV